MTILKAVRAIVLVLIMITAIWFTVVNPGERVRIDPYFWEPLENVPLVEALFFAFALGLAAGLMVGVVRIMELKGQLRSMRKTGAKLEGELSTLRNLPLEEVAEELSEGTGLSS